MNLAELHLGGFGKFTDFTLFFSPSFTMVVGPNEAGKTTLAAAVLGVLFGFRRGLKHLRHRYRPWTGGPYTASLLLAEEDGRRYLIGRDFEHDRLEIFCGQGMRLEPLPEAELPGVLEAAFGVGDPLLFESTLLLRRPEAGSFRRERIASWALAEALGLIRGQEEAEHGDRRSFSLGSDKEAYTAIRSEQDEPLSDLLREKERLSGLIASLDEEERLLQKRRAELEVLQACLEERKKLEKQPEEIRLQLAEADGKQKGKEGPAGPDITSLARAEELANQIAVLEVELRYEEEGLRDYEAEIDILEREIALTRAKLEGLDPCLLNAEVQDRVTRVLPIINEHMARLGELFPVTDRLVERRRRLRRHFYALLGLGFAAAVGSLGLYGFLLRPYSFVLPGLGAASWCGAVSLLVWSARLRARIRRLETEIEERETELKARRAEIESLLQGKTLGQYQAELEAKRLYENDLWHLEQTLAQKKAGKGPAEKVKEIKEALEAAKKELAGILAAGGWTELAEMRAKIEASRREASSSLEVLRAQEEALLRRLEEFSGLSLHFDPSELSDLAAAEEKIRARLAEARLRLAEVEAEMALRATEGKGENDEVPATPSLPREVVPIVDRTVPAPEIARRMGEILDEVTGGRYGGVRLEFGPEGFLVEVENPATGKLLRPADLSAGSLAQLRLAMHVAFAEQLTGSVNPPFLLDDPFAELDETRLRLTVAFLARLSRRRQIVWFTRQGEIVRILEETGIAPEVIELGGS
ncbi:MAG: ATP-binding protein [Bacillota bacterium]